MYNIMGTVLLIKSLHLQDPSKCGSYVMKKILSVHTIVEWLTDYNYITLGRSGSSDTMNHKPLLFSYMSKHTSDTCSELYKFSVDNVWDQLILHQFAYYITWAQAREAIDKEPEYVRDRYVNKLKSRLEFMKNKLVPCI